MAGEAEQKGFVLCVGSLSGNKVARSQSLPPVWRSKQSKLRFVPPLVACVTKTFPLATIGEELPGPGSFTCHATFSVLDQFSGIFFSLLRPLPLAPRQVGQSSACKKVFAAISNGKRNWLGVFTVPCSQDYLRVNFTTFPSTGGLQEVFVQAI